MRKAAFAAISILVTIATLRSAVTETTAKAGGGHETVRDQLIGSWRLAWVEEQSSDGKAVRPKRTGIIMYSRDGHMSVQIMSPEHDAGSSSNPVKYDQNGYEAYYGTYEVDEQAHTVTHHVEGALVRTLVGRNLTRVYRFEGNQLLLKSSRPDEHWSIAWERY